MVTKRLLRPERRRRVPKHFSWVDHRLVSERHLERCGPEGGLLYLFLLTVADADGVSYYADASIARRLGIDESRLHNARNRLVYLDLVAFEPPLYQVLELPPSPTPQPSPTHIASRPRSIAELIRAMGAPPR
jgi:hypothetical protein